MIIKKLTASIGLSLIVLMANVGWATDNQDQAGTSNAPIKKKHQSSKEHTSKHRKHKSSKGRTSKQKKLESTPKEIPLDLGKSVVRETWELHDILPESDDLVIKKYVDIIKNGLPHTSGPRKKVLIVGSGVAGLVSAQLLADAGHAVTIFEANDRIGGRILTLREPFTGGFYAEAGAMRIPTTDQLIGTYTKKWQLKTNPFYQVDVNPNTGKKANNGWILMNGVKMRRSEYLEKAGAGLGFNLEPQEQGYTAEELLDKATAELKTYTKNHPRKHWEDLISRYDKYSIHQFLKKFTLYSPNAIDYIEVMNNLESRSNLSFIQNLIELSLINSENTYYEFTDGSDNFPAAWIEPLLKRGVKIHFNERLTGVEWSNDASGKCKLSFERNTRNEGKIGLGHQLAAKEFVDLIEGDVCILTIPVPAQRYVDFNPILPAPKRKIIRELYHDSATKIFLQFSERFWEKNDNIFGGGSITDLPGRMIYYPSHKFGSDSGGVVLASYTWETEARGWDALTNEERIKYALDDLAKVHGEYIRELCIGGASHSWGEDQFALGEAAMFAPDQLSELQGDIPNPSGNIHFAGDYTTLRHAWIEGAIESGIRVSLEIDEKKV